MDFRLCSRCVVLAGLFLAGCANAQYFDESGKELPGLPFVWNDAEGRPHLAYVRTTSGIGAATFSIERSESGGYVEFTNNLDTKTAAQLTGDVLDRVFEAAMRAARAELKDRILRMEDAGARSAVLKELERMGP